MHCGLLRFEVERYGRMKDICGHESFGDSCAGAASCSAPGWRSMGGIATCEGRRASRGSLSLESLAIVRT
jgi:hypothetical protein